MVSDPMAVDWTFRYPRVGPVRFRIGREGDFLVAEWTDGGTLRANASGTWHCLTPPEGSDPEEFAQRIGLHVEALLRHLRGGTTLHASSAGMAGTAIALLGDTMAGKSTLAAQLCEDPRVEFFADDATVLSFEPARIHVVQSETTHDLRPDVASAMGIQTSDERKVQAASKRQAREAARLGAMVALTFDASVSEPQLARLRGVEAFSILSLSLSRFALDVSDILRHELDQLARLIREVPLFELRRPPGLEHLHTSHPLVLELLEAAAEGRIATRAP
jgi:hypothetical protein